MVQKDHLQRWQYTWPLKETQITKEFKTTRESVEMDKTGSNRELDIV